MYIQINFLFPVCEKLLDRQQCREIPSKPLRALRFSSSNCTVTKSG